MKDFINQFSAWQMFLGFVVMYFIMNILIAKQFSSKAHTLPNYHRADKYFGIVLFFIIGVPVVLWNAVKPGK